MMTQTQVPPGTILDASGQPFEMESRALAKQDEITGEAVLKAYTVLASAVNNLRLPAFRRAQDPFGNNAWVYACGVAIALNAAQAPFVIYTESDDAQTVRMKGLMKHGRWM